MHYYKIYSSVNQNFSYQDKIDFICCTFEVAFSDGELHYIEEFFINNHRKRQLKPEFDKLREMKTKIVDYPIAIEARDGINHGYGWENHKPYLNNYFSIVTETLYFQGGGYCSEKIWKPFAYFHPIILVGSPGSLKYVREFGFKTFHNLK